MRAFGGSNFERLFDVFGRLLPSAGFVTPRPHADELQSYYMQMSIAASLRPVDFETLPIDKLIEFRLEHEQELTRLQQHVSSLRRYIEAVAQVEGVVGGADPS